MRVELVRAWAGRFEAAVVHVPAGAVVADAVTVLGEVTGEIFANHLTLKKASSVAANIFHKHLSLEDGCYFEGKSRRHADPLQLAT